VGYIVRGISHVTAPFTPVIVYRDDDRLPTERMDLYGSASLGFETLGMIADEFLTLF
jgi:hypothetical protein